MSNPRPLPVSAHPRNFEANRYVYPVLSRRAGGISIGVNLNLDKICNFHCVYCQVDRGEPGEKEFVELPRLRQNWSEMVELVTLRADLRGNAISRHARAAAAAERHRLERRRRADHLRQFRRGRRRLRRSAPPAAAWTT